MDSQKKDPLYKSFGYAFEGIGTCIKKERNMKIIIFLPKGLTFLGF